jgi:hypothetical protein
MPGPWSATLITARGNPEMTFRIAGVVDQAVVYSNRHCRPGVPIDHRHGESRSGDVAD